METGQTPLSWVSDRVATAAHLPSHRTPPMHELHCHRHGQSAGVHVSSSRLHTAHHSVKPSISWHVDSSTFMNTYRTTGFTKTGQRPRGANS